LTVDGSLFTASTVNSQHHSGVTGNDIIDALRSEDALDSADRADDSNTQMAKRRAALLGSARRWAKRRAALLGSASARRRTI
jgi:hypothetical protein